MSTIQLSLPESVLKEAREMAERDNVPLDQYVALIISRHVAARQGIEYLKARAQGASRQKFLAILARSPDAPPVPVDEVEP